MRLIDADALTKRYCKEPAKGDCKNCDWYGDSWCRCEVFGAQIEEFPTIDAEPVVRCVKCEKQQNCKLAQYLGNNGFCSYGERRADK